LDKATVKNIANLARINVPEEKMDSLASELTNIFGWIEQLNEVDTDNVKPMTSVTEMEAPQRADEVNDGGYADRVLKNAPDHEGAFYTVPKVVD
jgi:aspartyl-tRNA(Asn)/glutamyl-tRNA(Gln) amidotransferase subunit C|tara:strand:- start:532 stop:813 length:282 start_codon:yes stop_codon:yes gene_type:complete